MKYLILTFQHKREEEILILSRKLDGLLLMLYPDFFLILGNKVVKRRFILIFPIEIFFLI
jgi:hypothetical protein